MFVYWLMMWLVNDSNECDAVTGSELTSLSIFVGGMFL